MTSFIDALKMEHEKTNLPKLKIAFIDFWPEWNDENFITPILEKNYNIIIDNKKPEIVFYSIFGNNNAKYKCKKILYVAENIRYPYNQTIRNNINTAYRTADYTISFDPETNKNYRLPLWQVFILRNPSYWNNLTNKVQHDNFERFCSFTVSNPSNQERIYAFDKLSKYKKVHAYGKVRMNDLGLKKASNGKYWREAKDQFFIEHPHKFSITYENTSYPYYCTEKLMDSFLAGSIPLYSGDPKVVIDWNSKAFLNIPKLGITWLEAVKNIDTNKELFQQYYNEPVFTEDQQKNHKNNMDEFSSWLIEKINE